MADQTLGISFAAAEPLDDSDSDEGVVAHVADEDDSSSDPLSSDDDATESDDGDGGDGRDGDGSSAVLGISFSSAAGGDGDGDDDGGDDDDDDGLPDSDADDSDEELSDDSYDEDGLVLVLKYGAHGLTGRRKTMEDAHFAAVQASQKLETAETQGGPAVGFFSVFDGHGGDACALYLSQNMFPAVLETMPELAIRTKEVDPESLPSQAEELQAMETSLREAYALAESRFISLAESKNVDSGATAVSALIHGNKLVVANVGDSEAVLSRDGMPVNLTVIHNPAKNPAEEERIVAAGGRVYKKRVALPSVPPHLCNIAVSRAFGDILFKNTPDGTASGLTADPDAATWLIEPQDEFLILACDGVWDVMTHEEAVDEVSSSLAASQYDPQAAVECLVKAAYARGSTDNITALVVLFEFVPEEDLLELLEDDPSPPLALDVNGEPASTEFEGKVSELQALGNGFSPVAPVHQTGTIKLMPRTAAGPSTPTAGGSGITFAATGAGSDSDDGVSPFGVDSDESGSDDEWDEKALWPGKLAAYTEETPLNGAQRNVPGTKRDELFAWKAAPLEEQTGSLEVQQYLQQLIRSDPADVDKIVETPEGVSSVVWQYEHLRQLTLELSHLAVMLEECGCSPESCPKMKATQEWMFLCAAHKEPQECSAIDYMCHTLEGAAALLNSQKYFPSRINLKEADAKPNLQSVARRLYRICAHAFFAHNDAFEEFEAETHTTERAVKLAARYKLVGRKMRIIPPVEEW
ncbi:protein phosphatase 2C [Thecamonas trahens ATCC 50062]|uniref:Protein phosphatase 2C n=1 Tax=Thecamonas trahens ATCC 50062 TaxID=461836 RepID=A0A0L0DJK6_THETB|nr:protein phosphatase 2C [Thecamonas trahens ATCC 50062]KNC52390.1 protein phosphatase 2C [Thecamonas trahens ATCC 50062]|eukprot:XP_013755434.1 protein phosphatase 2C [Thecamonas trahens ATCC 50062]